MGLMSKSLKWKEGLGSKCDPNVFKRFFLVNVKEIFER